MAAQIHFRDVTLGYDRIRRCITRWRGREGALLA